MDVLTQIRELEKKASEADAWRARYQRIVSEIENSIKVLSESIAYSGNTKTHKTGLRKPTDGIPTIAERIYAKLVSGEMQEATTDTIRAAFLEDGIRDNSTNITAARKRIMALPGMVQINRGVERIGIFDRSKAINPKEIPDQLKDRVITETVKHTTGDAFGIEPTVGDDDYEA